MWAAPAARTHHTLQRALKYIQGICARGAQRLRTVHIQVRQRLSTGAVQGGPKAGAATQRRHIGLATQKTVAAALPAASPSHRHPRRRGRPGRCRGRRRRRRRGPGRARGADTGGRKQQVRRRLGRRLVRARLPRLASAAHLREQRPQAQRAAAGVRPRPLGQRLSAWQGAGRAYHTVAFGPQASPPNSQAALRSPSARSRHSHSFPDRTMHAASMPPQSTNRCSPLGAPSAAATAISAPGTPAARPLVCDLTRCRWVKERMGTCIK